MHGRFARLNGAPLLLAVVTLLSLLVALQFTAGCGGDDPAVDETQEAAITTVTAADSAEEAGDGTEATSLTVYSGRSEDLVGPLMDQFEQSTGIRVEVRYGDTAELAGTILEEGQNSPADVFLAQDAGALGAVAAENRFQVVGDDLLERVDERFRSQDGTWVGVSGRARVVVYNTEVLTEADLPDSIFDFTRPEWKGRLGWAPTNGSFQAFVTALRVTAGEEAAREWLEGVQANEPRVYEKNTPIVEAVGAGEIEVGFVNHYYLYRFYEERGDDFPAANYHFPGEDPGNLINVAGAGILDSAPNPAGARDFIAFMLSTEAQTHFGEETNEYPLIDGVESDLRLKPLSEVGTPEVDLSDLQSLEETLSLLQELGIL